LSERKPHELTDSEKFSDFMEARGSDFDFEDAATNARVRELCHEYKSAWTLSPPPRIPAEADDDETHENP